LLALQPDLKVFAVTFGVWTIVNFTFGIIPLVLGWVLRPWTGANSILPVSIICSVTTFVYFYLRLSGGVVTRILLAATSPFAFLAAFEIVYQHLFLVADPANFRTDLEGEIVLGSWLLLGLTTLTHWKLTKKALAVLALMAIAFGIWLLSGYPQVYGTNSTLAFVCNAATKSLTAVFFLTLLGGGTKVRNRRIG
jgi:hypothetical protein